MEPDEHIAEFGLFAFSITLDSELLVVDSDLSEFAKSTRLCRLLNISSSLATTPFSSWLSSAWIKVLLTSFTGPTKAILVSMDAGSELNIVVVVVLVVDGETGGSNNVKVSIVVPDER